MKKLYKFQWECGRQGDLGGLFVAEEADIQAIIGQDIYLRKALGKHSEIYGELTEEDLTVKSVDQAFIANLIRVMDGELTISGFNPLDYYEPEED